MMRRFLSSKTALPAALFLSALVPAACGGGSSAGLTPTGPGAAAGPAASQGNPPGMGNMGGMGMSMQVANEFEYLTQMIPHHVEAIETATLLQRHTDRDEMRTFAATIIRTQSAEVEQMKTWLARWYPGRDTRVQYEPMMRELTGLTGSALDRQFLDDMIPHHMGAVMMSQQLIARRLATHQEVVPFAAAIRDTQRQEIQMMSGWLQAWFGVTAGHGGR